MHGADFRPPRPPGAAPAYGRHYTFRPPRPYGTAPAYGRHYTFRPPRPYGTVPADERPGRLGKCGPPDGTGGLDAGRLYANRLDAGGENQPSRSAGSLSRAGRSRLVRSVARGRKIAAARPATAMAAEIRKMCPVASP